MRTIICLAAFLFCVVAKGAERPNFLFILADDLGVADLGCYEREDHKTPNLDRLASEGLRFTSAYCAQPICSPSRASIMTGKNPARLHITTYLPGRTNASSQMLLHPEMRQQLPTEEVTLAEMLRDKGYQTAYFGKWHLGGKGSLPTDHGFSSYYPGKANTKPGSGEGSKGEFDLTSKAIEFLQTNKTSPFFLFLAHNTPHIPYSPRKLDTNAFNPEYADVIQAMDESIGILLNALTTHGLDKNTVVIFTSDNGGLHVPEGPHKRVTHNGFYRAGKGYLYEGGLRIPLIVRLPGTKPKVIDIPTVNTDWYPTLLELAGVASPKNLDGQSIAKLLKTGRGSAKRTIYWHFPHYNNQGGRPGGAIRDEDWKLIENYENGQVELYNLDTDPTEKFDERTSALKAQQMQRIALRLQKKLQEWKVKAGVQTNVVNPDFKPEEYGNIYTYYDTTRFEPQNASPEEWETILEWRKRMDAVVRKKN